MQRKKKQSEIKTLTPDHFKRLYIRVDAADFNENTDWADFCIYDLAYKGVRLKYPFPPHRSTVNDLIFVRKGGTVRGQNTDRFVSEANSLTIFPALTITETLSMNEGTEGYYLHFSDKFLMNGHFRMNDLVRVKSALPPFLNLDDAHARIIYRILQRIDHLDKKGNQQDLIRLYLLTLFKEIEMYHLKSNTLLKSKPDITVEKFKVLVSENLYKHRNVAYYACLLHVTPNHLNKLIKDSAGMSAKALINQMIILEIKVLLLQTNLSVSEIAFEMNFNDVAYFSRFFSKHANTNPMAFRKTIEWYKT